MVLELKDFKETCSKLLLAINDSELSTLTNVLELKTEGKTLILLTTNGEYSLSIKFPLDHEETFKATVSAALFLKFITSITTKNVELKYTEKYLEVKWENVYDYKVPLIYNDDKLLEIEEIKIKNPTTSLKISGDILQSIVEYNGRELQKISSVNNTVQKCFYIDETGCLTYSNFTACYNSFNLEKPIRILVNQKTVKLFKLFKDSMTDCVLGYDPINNEITQTKLSISTDTINLVVITDNNNGLLEQGAAHIKAIRETLNYNYTYSMGINKNELLQALNRLLLFKETQEVETIESYYIKINISSAGLCLKDNTENNIEQIQLTNTPNAVIEYSMILNGAFLKSILESIQEDFIRIDFGNKRTVLIKWKNVINVLSEVNALY